MTLRELTREAAGFSAAFDPSLLDERAARSAVELSARLEKIAASIKARAAKRLAETGTHRARGEKSPAHDLAKLSGTSVGAAAEALSTADKLEALPEVAAAAATGELSASQTAMIANALAANPTANAEDLVAKARHASHNELRDECERVRAAGDGGAEARRRRIHDERFLRRARHGDGSASLTLRDNPEVIASVMAAIVPARTRLFEAARRDGRRERPEALDADALVATVTGAAGNKRGGGGGAGGAKVLVRVDFDTLLRGYSIDGEVCEIAGYGPVAVSAVRDLLATDNAFLAAIVTKGQRVVGVAHLGRAPTAVQQSALEWKDPVCTRLGCPNASRLERDHRVDWATTKITLLDWLDRLCPSCHDLKTLHGWALVDGTGKREMVPPTDPRHPRHERRPRAGPRTHAGPRPRAGPAPPPAV